MSKQIGHFFLSLGKNKLLKKLNLMLYFGFILKNIGKTREFL